MITIRIMTIRMGIEIITIIGITSDHNVIDGE